MDILHYSECSERTNQQEDADTLGQNADSATDQGCGVDNKRNTGVLKKYINWCLRFVSYSFPANKTIITFLWKFLFLLSVRYLQFFIT